MNYERDDQFQHALRSAHPSLEKLTPTYTLSDKSTRELRSLEHDLAGLVQAVQNELSDRLFRMSSGPGL